MATWAELSEENLQAAEELLSLGLYRSSISRFYYCVYAAVSQRLDDTGISFPLNHEGPKHATLPDSIVENLGNIPLFVRHDLRKLVGQLYRDRVIADYQPSLRMGKEQAQKAGKDARVVLWKLGKYP